MVLVTPIGTVIDSSRGHPAHCSSSDLTQGEVPEGHEVDLLDDAFKKPPVRRCKEGAALVEDEGLGLARSTGLELLGLGVTLRGLQLHLAVDHAHAVVRLELGGNKLKDGQHGQVP